MAQTKVPTSVEDNHDELVVARAKGFWQQYSKPLTYSILLLALVIGGALYYQNFVKLPKEEKANDAVFYVQKSFSNIGVVPDSLKTLMASNTLNGDGSANIGALKIISKYDGTAAANLCNYYAGACYLQMKQFDKAIKYLQNFNTSATQIKSRALGMMGDAYAEQKKNDNALDYYTKAAEVNEKDDFTSSEFLFRAALFAETVGRKKDAVDLYRKLREKYPLTQKGNDADKYLARLGDLND